MAKNNKSKDLFNINNLEEAKQILQEITGILEKQHSTASEYMEDTEKLNKAYTKLNSLSASTLKELNFATRGNQNKQSELTKAEIDNLTEVVKLQQQRLQNEIDYKVAVDNGYNNRKKQKESELNRQKLLNKEYISNLNQQASYYGTRQYKQIGEIASEEYSKLPLTQRLLLNKKQYVSKYQNQYAQNYEQKLDERYKLAYDTGGTFDYKDIKSVGDEVFNSTKSDIGKNLIEGSTKLKAASDVLGVAGKTLKAGVDKFFSIFTNAVNKQANIYEQTFQGISTRTGTTRGRYYSEQAGLNNTLGSLGLRDNIATSEVQKMWESLAKTGMNESKMFERALDNTLTKNIVPYLNTSTQEFNLLSMRLGPEFVKDIRGINRSNLEIAGNNYLTQDLLNNIISEVQPMADVAEQELVKGSEELTGYLNKLMAPKDAGGAGLSKDQAMSIVTKLNKARTQGYDMLKNGGLADKMLMTTIQEKGLNTEDITQWDDIAQEYTGIGQMIAGWGPGYGKSASGNMTMSIIGDSSQLPYSDIQAFQKMTEAGIKPGSDLGTSLTEEQVKEYAQQATDTFTAGDNQTNKQRQDITVENLTNEITVVKEFMGEYTTVIETAIKGIGTLINTLIGGKLLSGLFGGGLSKVGGSLASALGSAGPIALGIGAGAVAITAGVATAIKINNDAIDKSVSEKKDSAQGWYNEAIAQGKSEGAASVKSLQGFSQNFSEKHGFIDITKNFKLTKKLAESLGIQKHWNKGSGDEVKESLEEYLKNKKYKEYDRIKVAQKLYKSDDAGLDVLTMLIAANLAGQENDSAITEAIKDVTGTSVSASTEFINQMIGEGVAGSRMGEPGKGLADTVLNHARYLKQDDIHLSSAGGQWIGYDFDKETLTSKFNLLRQGTDEVPYDNYPALLHEGEAVLTASTAGEMRNLVDEYRQSNEQAINFETIIQAQTSELVNKMDQIINVIGGESMFTQDNQKRNEGSEKLRNSLLKVSSTRGF